MPHWRAPGCHRLGAARWDARIVGVAWSARTLRRAKLARPRKQSKVHRPKLRSAARKSLLLGTALASTLLLGTLLAPAPVHAAVNCPPGTFPPPGPIAINNPADDIVCVNVFDRYNNAGDTIHLSTNGVNEYIYLNNSGVLTASNVRPTPSTP